MFFLCNFFPCTVFLFFIFSLQSFSIDDVSYKYLGFPGSDLFGNRYAVSSSVAATTMYFNTSAFIIHSDGKEI